MSLRKILLIPSALCVVFALGLFLITQPAVTPIRSQSPPVDAQRLQAHVKYLSVDLYPRSFEQFQHLEAAARYIQDELAATGAHIEVQEVVVQEAKYKNIIAYFGPKTGKCLVIGAHYDSHGDARQGAQPTLASHTPGADDNASGVAGLLELARLLARMPPSRPVELVAYTLEEPPHFRSEHMGSHWHARRMRERGQEVEYMLSLEMIGYFSDQLASQHYPLAALNYLYPERGNFIAVVGKFSDFGITRHIKATMAGASDLPVHSINAPPLLEGIDFSDHRNYWHAGYPALMITDTSFMRNPHYHQAQDTFEKLDYLRMAKVVQGVFALTQQAAQ